MPVKDPQISLCKVPNLVMTVSTILCPADIYRTAPVPNHELVSGAQTRIFEIQRVFQIPKGALSSNIQTFLPRIRITYLKVVVPGERIVVYCNDDLSIPEIFTCEEGGRWSGK
ncbi:hypothetical protein AB6A40_004923 [Gnathostoma spinigerum]|uniref:Uncharacterized protein n=1 Tax=Gnathostoma spinigerum TaxID=75299 RepID=A0ABD6ELM7_9BILA